MHILERFFRNSDIRLLVLGIGVSLFAPSCAYVATATPDSVARYVQYMNRAAQADDAAWRRMKAEAERDYQQSQTLANQLRVGLLLTSPNRPRDGMWEEIHKGRQLLQDVVEHGGTGLNAEMRGLVNTRLQEVAAREALHRELRDTEQALQKTEARLNDAERKLNELLDIENSMEEAREESDGMPR